VPKPCAVSGSTLLGAKWPAVMAHKCPNCVRRYSFDSVNLAKAEGFPCRHPHPVPLSCSRRRRLADGKGVTSSVLPPNTTACRRRPPPPPFPHPVSSSTNPRGPCDPCPPPTFAASSPRGPRGRSESPRSVVASRSPLRVPATQVKNPCPSPS